MRPITRKSSCPAVRRGRDPSTDHQTTGSTPDKTTCKKRTRFSELEDKGGKRKVAEDENGSLNMDKSIQNIFTISVTSSEDPSDDPGTDPQTTGSSKGGRTRNLKRKASPDKTPCMKRTRVSELVEPSTSFYQEKRGKRKVAEDENGSLNMDKSIQNIFNLSVTSSKDPGDVSSHGQEDKGGPFFNPSDDIRANTVRVSSDENGKRKAADAGEEPSRKRTKNLDLVVEEDEDDEKDQRAQFEALYHEQQPLGQGGCGSVYAGHRKSDYLPVALKHIYKDDVYYKNMEKTNQLCTEVSIMLKLHAGSSRSVGSSAPIALLDWFDLSEEIILVLERPSPCKDLLSYVWDNGASLEEDDAKIILKQLIDAAIHLENISIFHRDIKLENILIDTSSHVPRLRLIDFGLSCVGQRTSQYFCFYGTPNHIPPEWYSRNTYSAGPTTVWQVGVVLYDVLHRLTRFQTTSFLSDELIISESLSEDCKDFLQKCFSENPMQRPTLKELRCHPWLR